MATGICHYCGKSAGKGELFTVQQRDGTREQRFAHVALHGEERRTAHHERKAQRMSSRRIDKAPDAEAPLPVRHELVHNYLGLDLRITVDNATHPYRD